MFRVVSGSPHTIWAPLDSTGGEIGYVGQLVKSTGDGVGNLGAASGAADTTTKGIPFGVIVGVNNRTPVYDSTNLTTSITSVTTQAAQLAREYTGVEGRTWDKGDPQAFVQIALITAETVLYGPIYNAALGTGPTVLTVTTGSTTGLGFTSNACDFTPVADLCTSYCRTGANMGKYRISDDTSTTVETNDVAFPYDIAVGDTFVRVPIRPIGRSYMQTDAEALYIDASASPATDYWVIQVLELNLREANQEHCIFRFGSVHFDDARA